MLLAIFLTVALLSIAQAKRTVEQANKYVDEVLNGPFAHNKEVLHFLPHKLADHTIHLKRGGKSITVKMTHGVEERASRLERRGDCMTSRMRNDKFAQTRVECGLIMKEMWINYNLDINVVELEHGKSVQEMGAHSSDGEDSNNETTKSQALQLRVNAKDIWASLEIVVKDQTRKASMKSLKIDEKHGMELVESLKDSDGDYDEKVSKKIRDKIRQEITREIEKVFDGSYSKLLKQVVDDTPF